MLNDVSSLAVSGGGCPASTIRGTAQPAGGRSLPGPPGEPWLAGPWGGWEMEMNLQNRWR